MSPANRWRHAARSRTAGRALGKPRGSCSESRWICGKGIKIERWSQSRIDAVTLRTEARKRTGKLPAPTLSAAVTWLKDRADWREYGLETARVAIQRADGSVPSKRTVQRKQLRISTFPRRPNHCGACGELGHGRRSKKCPKNINQKLTELDDESGKVNEQ